MKALKQILGSITTYSTADTVNAHAFPAWTMNDHQRLEQLAMTGTLGNSFYASAKDATDDAVRLLQRAHAGELANAIIRGRNEGFIRTFPLLGLVYLSMKDAELFKRAFPKVVLTGNDLVDFIDLAKEVRGLGRSVKTAINAWIAEKTTPYYAQKYRRQIADAIRLSRFKGDDPIYAYVLNAYTGVKGFSNEKLDAAYAKYPELAAHRDFVEFIKADELGLALEVIKKHALDVDSLTDCYSKFNRELWQETARRTPVMRFLKYMAKFLREGVDILPLMEEKLTVENLRRAKVFPFRIYTASLALPTLRWMTRNYLVDLLDEYTTTYDWNEFNNYRWVIAPDMSCSMKSRVGDSDILTFAHISAMFTGFFYKGLDHVTILPWNTEVREYTVKPEKPVMTHINKLMKMVCGGTHMEVALKHMISHKTEVDYAVFLTDTEEYGTGWLASWKKYHALYPKASAFLLRADSYQSQPISDEMAEKLNIYQIFGWNDSVLDYMHYIIKNKGHKND